MNQYMYLLKKVHDLMGNVLKKKSIDNKFVNFQSHSFTMLMLHEVNKLIKNKRFE